MEAPKDREGLVEMIARAICESEGFNPGQQTSEWPADDPTFMWHAYTDNAEEVITTLEAAGLRVVPAVATEGMKDSDDAFWSSECGYLEDVWDAMVGASPYAPGGGR